MKVCSKCAQSKDESEFFREIVSRGGGLRAQCKDCMISAHRNWCKNNPKRNLEYHHDYIARNPEKRAAHNLVNSAIKCGRLFPQPCEVCGKKAQAHHDDYSEPLEVRWLCPMHHTEHHKKYPELR